MNSKLKKLISLILTMLVLAVVSLPATSAQAGGPNDPGVAWNTFLGGAGDDAVVGTALDATGNLYVVGYSSSTWGTPLASHSGGTDIFVAKLGKSGKLLWHTFLGGNGEDYGVSIVVDAAGNLYIAGVSNATWGTPVDAYVSGLEGFAAKLSSAGVLQWNTFLGDSGDDTAYSITLGDSDASAFIAGSTGDNSYFSKLNAANGSFIGASVFGGAGTDEGKDIVLDDSGNIYITGNSTATWGTPIRAHTNVKDMFVVKFNSSGVLQWNTFLGGTNTDESAGLDVDSDGNVYVAGYSGVSWGTPLNAYTAQNDIVTAKLNTNGALQWHTFHGGTGNDNGYAIAVTGNGDVIVGGGSLETWGTPLQPHNGGWQGFLFKLNTAGSLQWNTFMGGADDNWVTGLTLSNAGNTIHAAMHSRAAWGKPVRPFSSAEEAGLARFAPLINAKSSSAQDGWVLESTETSTAGGTMNQGNSTINIGDDSANRQYRAILSFNTKLPANAVITNITLKFKYAGTSGTLPFNTHGKLMVDVRKGLFSNNAALQLNDFNAGANKNGLFALSKTLANKWYITSFAPAQFTYINKAGVTQFRLRFAKDDNNDLGADFIKIHSGSAALANRPQLIIEYYIP